MTTTLGSSDAAKALARALVEARLAACVQIMPIDSIYRWDGEIENAPERLLTCKIVAADFPAVEAAIRERHAYDVPEIVMTPIAAGHAPYLDWVAASCARAERSP